MDIHSTWYIKSWGETMGTWIILHLRWHYRSNVIKQNVYVMLITYNTRHFYLIFVKMFNFNFIFSSILIMIKICVNMLRQFLFWVLHDKNTRIAQTRFKMRIQNVDSTKIKARITLERFIHLTRVWCAKKRPLPNLLFCVQKRICFLPGILRKIKSVRQ